MSRWVSRTPSGIPSGSHVTDGDRDGDLCAADARLLASPDPAVVDAAALAWCRWEDTHVSLAPGVEPRLQRMPSARRRIFARLVTHDWSNGSFLDHRPILANMEALERTPAVLIHGRYDVSGPLDTAWDLHQRWPASELVVLDDAGHGGGSMTAALVEAINS